MVVSEDSRVNFLKGAANYISPPLPLLGGENPEFGGNGSCEGSTVQNTVTLAESML